MRTLLTSFILVLLVNAVALGGLVAWLGTTDRLSRDRVKQAVAVFSTTLQEEAANDAQAEETEVAVREMAEKAMRLEQVSGGPVTPEARLDGILRVDEKQKALIERQKKESQALQRQLTTQMRMVEAKIAELDAKRQAFDEAVAAQLGEMQDEDFKEAVGMLQGIPPKQAKAIFQELLKDGGQEQVVSYLAAMEQRKAAGVLKAFKQPNEVAQATELIEMLRQRSEKFKTEADL